MKSILLYAGEYPGHWNSEIARGRLEYLLATGIRTFIDLTTPQDHLEPYEGLLEELGTGLALSLRRISESINSTGIMHAGQFGAYFSLVPSQRPANSAGFRYDPP